MTVPSIYDSDYSTWSSPVSSHTSGTFTVPSGLTDPALLVCVAMMDTQTGSPFEGAVTVKWGGSGGDALTLIPDSEGSFIKSTRQPYMGWFLLLNPTAQSSTVYWTNSVQEVSCGSVAMFLLEDVADADTVMEMVATGYDTAASVSPSLTALSGDSLLIYAAMARGGDVAFTTSGATEVLDYISDTDTTVDVSVVFATETGASGTQGCTFDLSTSEFGVWSALQVAGTTPTGPTYTLTVDAGTFTLTGVAAVPKAGRKLTAAVGAYTLTGVAASPKAARRLTATLQTYTLTGVAAVLTRGRVFTVDVATVTLTGNAATLTLSRTLTADTEAFTLTGTDTALARGFGLAATAGGFTLTGNDTGLVASRLMSGATATYTLTGYDVVFSSELTLSTEVATYTLTGGETGLIVTRAIAVEPGAFVLTGNDAVLGSLPVLVAGTGTVTFTGNDASLVVSRALAPSAGSLTLIGQDAALLRLFTLAVASGSYTLSGQAAGLVAGRVLMTDYVTLALVGWATQLTYSAVELTYFVGSVQSYAATGTAKGVTHAGGVWMPTATGFVRTSGDIER